MPETKLAAFRGYDDPMDVVDDTDTPYAERLALLQDWKADLAGAGPDDPAQKAILGAIQALEVGAEVQDDGPEAASDGGYGAERDA